MQLVNCGNPESLLTENNHKYLDDKYLIKNYGVQRKSDKAINKNFYLKASSHLTY